jgi:hypothetical protein
MCSNFALHDEAWGFGKRSPDLFRWYVSWGLLLQFNLPLTSKRDTQLENGTKKEKWNVVKLDSRFLRRPSR